MDASERISALPPSSLLPVATTAWAYLRHELIYLAWALVETSLLAPLALAAMPWARLWSRPIFTLWLLFLMLVPFNLNRALSLGRLSVRRRQRISFLALLLAIFFSVRSLLYETTSLLDLSWLAELYGHLTEESNPYWARDLVIFFLVAIAWWRGLSFARRYIDINDVGLRFRVGALILAPGVVVAGMLPYMGGVVGYLALFFLASLMAVALTRAEQVAHLRTGRGYPMRPRWLGVIFASSLATVVAGALAALALSGRVAAAITGSLPALWDAFNFFGLSLVMTVTHLLLFVLRPLALLFRYLMRLLRDAGLANLPQLERPLDGLTDNQIDQLLQDITGPNAQLLLWINRAVTLIIILAVLLLLYLALARYFRQREMALFGEEGVAIPKDGEETLSLGQRLRQRLGLWQRRRAAATVRRIYQEMSQDAAARGFPRTVSQTPYEYLATLSETWPTGDAEVRLITEAYVRVRYGELPESEEEMAVLRAAWKRLQAMPPPEQ